MSSQSTPGAATEKQVATAPQSAMESLGGGGVVPIELHIRAEMKKQNKREAKETEDTVTQTKPKHTDYTPPLAVRS